MKNVIANPLCKSTLRNHISSHFFLKAFEVELEARLKILFRQHQAGYSLLWVMQIFAETREF